MIGVAHFSDNHGSLDLIDLYSRSFGNEIDLWVTTGDFLKNKTRGVREIEVPYQRNWFSHNKEKLKAIFGDKPVLVVMGNHDFYPVAKGLKEIGVNARYVGLGITEVHGIKFAGFPFIPYIYGEWNFESQEDQLREAVDKIWELKPDVLLTHAPPGGILDSDCGSNHWGIASLTSKLSYSDWTPKTHLFGHVHEMGGQRQTINGCTFINSATVVTRFRLADASDELPVGTVIPR